MNVSEEELREAYYRLGNQKEVADELGCSDATVSRKMKKYGIEARKDNPTRDLYDAEKMRQYYEEEQSIDGVASRLQGSPSHSAVIKWLRKHGVETNHRHATRGEKIKKECEVCGDEEVVWKSTVKDNNSWYCSRGCLSEDAKVESTPERPYRGGWRTTAEQIRKRDGCCRRCGVDPDNTLQVHHIIPLREFEDPADGHEPDNLVALCPTCHGIMEQMTEEEQREVIE